MRMTLQGSTAEVQSVLQKFNNNEQVQVILETNGHRTIEIAETIDVEPKVNPQKAYWARMSPEARSKEVRRRLKLGRRTK